MYVARLLFSETHAEGAHSEKGSLVSKPSAGIVQEFQQNLVAVNKLRSSERMGRHGYLLIKCY